MNTNVAFNARKALSGVAAAVVVAFGAATLDQGHLIGAPKGATLTIENSNKELWLTYPASGTGATNTA